MQNLQQFKLNGVVRMDYVLSIPADGRIPVLVKTFGIEKVHATIVARLTIFCNSYNVVRPMSAQQIVVTAAVIIESANEDHLALEDILLFFDGAAKNQYGRVLDHIDQHVIFEMFEKYRQARHEMMLNIKDELQTKYKSIGDNTRFSNERNDLNHAGDVEFLKAWNDYHAKQQ